MPTTAHTKRLPTPHLQPDTALESSLAQMLWGDGAAAAVVSVEATGLVLGTFFATTLPDSHGLMHWAIGDMGFATHLSGDVPGRIAQAVAHDEALRAEIGPVDAIDGWAVHAGVRSVLDAAKTGLKLSPEALGASIAPAGRRGTPKRRNSRLAWIADRVALSGNKARRPALRR